MDEAPERIDETPVERQLEYLNHELNKLRDTVWRNQQEARNEIRRVLTCAAIGAYCVLVGFLIGKGQAKDK